MRQVDSNGTMVIRDSEPRKPEEEISQDALSSLWGSLRPGDPLPRPPGSSSAFFTKRVTLTAQKSSSSLFSDASPSSSFFSPPLLPVAAKIALVQLQLPRERALAHPFPPQVCELASPIFEGSELQWDFETAFWQVSSYQLEELVWDFKAHTKGNFAVLRRHGSQIPFDTVQRLKLSGMAVNIPPILTHCHYSVLSTLTIHIPIVKSAGEFWEANTIALTGIQSLRRLEVKGRAVEKNAHSFWLSDLVVHLSVQQKTYALTELCLELPSPFLSKPRALRNFLLLFPELKSLWLIVNRAQLPSGRSHFLPRWGGPSGLRRFLRGISKDGLRLVLEKLHIYGYMPSIAPSAEPLTVVIKNGKVTQC